MKVMQRLMAHGFAGCLTAVIGIAIGGWLGYSVPIQLSAGSHTAEQAKWDDLFAPILAIVFRVASVVIVAVVGAVCGFFTGAIANIAVVRFSARKKNAMPPDQLTLNPPARTRETPPESN